MAWEELAAVLQERRDEIDREKTDPPLACPNDGTPLKADPNGGLRCPFDGWHYPTDPPL